MGVSGPSGGRRASDSTPSHHRSHACGKLVWAIARRGNVRGRNYPRPDQDMIAEPRTGIIKHLGLQSPACSGHLCNTFSGIFHNIGGYLGLYRFLRLRWTWPGDGSAEACRRGRRTLRSRLVDRKSGGRRVSTLCLRRKPSKTHRNLFERRKAAQMSCYFSPAPAAPTCASAVGGSGIRAAAMSRLGARPLSALPRWSRAEGR